MNLRRLTLNLAASTAGLLAAAFIPVAVASADGLDELFTPDPSTFSPAPTAGFFEYATGTEKWNSTYLGTPPDNYPDGFTTTDTFEKFGSTTNDYAVATSVLSGPIVGSEIDYLQLGGGFANEFVYEPGATIPITDLLITPFGDVTLLEL